MGHTKIKEGWIRLYRTGEQHESGRFQQEAEDKMEVEDELLIDSTPSADPESEGKHKTWR